jgi:hypothetical protein
MCLLQSDSCFEEVVNECLFFNDVLKQPIQQTDTTIGEESSILRLAKCRANEVVQMLEAVLQQMRNFGDYVSKARPRMEDLVLQ